MDDWNFELINDVKCIVWTMTPETNIKRKTRKKTKEEVGKTHSEIVMLDSKTIKTGRIFCDGIMISNRLSW